MSSRKEIFLKIWLPLFSWMGFIFILSSVPGPDIPDLPIPFFHRVVHFFEYSILGVLWFRAFFCAGRAPKVLRSAIFAWILTAIFAASDEWHQTLVAGRSGKYDDVFFDVICAAIGIAVWWFAEKRFSSEVEK